MKAGLGEMMFGLFAVGIVTALMFRSDNSYSPPPVLSENQQRAAERERGIRKLSDETGVSMSEIRAAMDRLEGR
jgi:hypothetical protein